MTTKEQLGFKKLTLENWQKPDEINKYFIKRNFSTGETKEITENDRTKLFLKYELSENVPINVRKQFETARGALLYGYYFYPLFALGIDQLYRVAESAITHKCVNLSLTNKDSSYRKKLNQLKKHKIIDKDEFRKWESFRELRNLYTHSTSQSLYPHWEADFTLKSITKEINSLF